MPLAKLVWRTAAALILLALTSTCSLFSPRDEGPWRYRIRVADADRWLLEVTAELRSTTPVRLETADNEVSASLVSVRDGLDRPLSFHDGSWLAQADIIAGGKIQYEVELGALLGSRRDIDRGLQQGDAILTSWASWLLRPTGASGDIPVEIVLDPEVPIAAGATRHGDGLLVRSRDLHRSIYLALGSVAQRRVSLPSHPSLGSGNSEVEIALMPGRLTTPFDGYVSWTQDLLELVCDLWGGFPVERALIVVLPSGRRRGVSFGKVLPSSVPTVCLWVGSRTREEDFRGEWQFLHELLHLGFPMTGDVAAWLDEGLATYQEPLLRARAGWMSEAALWEELTDNMPRGLRALERRGIANGRGIDDRYWGGALFCLLVDLEARRRTGGRKGIEDGIRQLISEDMRVIHRVRSLEKILQAIDRGIGEPIAQQLWAKYGAQGSDVGWSGLLEKLGVIRESRSVELRDDAEWSRWRRALLHRPSQG